jgi:hypothetical protein
LSFVNLNIEYEGALERLRSKKELLNEALLETIGDLTTQLYELVEANLSGGVLERQTGALAQAVEVQAAAFVGAVCQSSVFIDESSEQWIIGMTHEYGGLGYYIILPKEASVLAWEGPEGMIFAHKVNHPPAKQRSFLNSALAEMEGQIVDEIKTTIAAVMAA